MQIHMLLFKSVTRNLLYLLCVLYLFQSDNGTWFAKQFYINISISNIFSVDIILIYFCPWSDRFFRNYVFLKKNCVCIKKKNHSYEKNTKPPGNQEIIKAAFALLPTPQYDVTIKL